MRLGSAAQTLFPNEIQSLGTKLDSMDIDQSLLSFLYKEIDHKTNLADYLKERKTNPIRLLADIRNIFAHGKLTAHSNQSNVTKNAEVLECLMESVLNMINNDFERKFRQTLQKEAEQLARIRKLSNRKEPNPNNKPYR